MKKATGFKLLVTAVLIGGSIFLLRQDFITFFIWWLTAGLLGAAFMPVTSALFEGFQDKGWMFSKAAAIAVCGFLTWFLTAVGLVPFTSLSCTVVTLVCVALSLFWGRRRETKGKKCFPWEMRNRIFWQEAVFFFVFLMWTYFAGFHPEAYGTEKYMDYGFMEAMMRSTELPAVDLWYSQGTINYYYGGQYFAVFLTKLTHTRVEDTYNLMRTFVAAFAFSLPCSLLIQMASDRCPQNGEKKIWIPFAGILGGVAVSLAGNMHYVIYSTIYPWLHKLLNLQSELKSYWFPDSTRYIGHNPVTNDQTIHEFPSYSFVLGDLHAHVVNIFFVLLLVGLLYSFMQAAKKRRDEEIRWREELLRPQFLAAAALLGMYQWTNFWDFVIYFVVTGGVVLFCNIVRYQGRIKAIAALTAVQAAEVLVIAYGVVIPFNMKFETMVQGVALAQNHSRFYQLCILWGLPVIITVSYIVKLLLENKKRNVYKWMEKTSAPDLYIFILGLCALGLILIPELVYVRDIYEDGNARANTMFKLTYQAFILFGISMAYILMRFLACSKKLALNVFAVAGTVLLLWTAGFLGNSVKAWFGQVWNPSLRTGLDATLFLEDHYPQDAAAIRWMKENIEGSPVVLEANGDSYSDYERVSAMTGLPTVLGWYVHEWLWRNDVADLNQKSQEIEMIYTSADVGQIQSLIEKYEIEYIFVGSMEREKYGDSLNTGILTSLGEIVYQDENSQTIILQVEK